MERTLCESGGKRKGQRVCWRIKLNKGEGQDKHMYVPNDGLYLDRGFLVLLLREQTGDLALGQSVGSDIE